MYFIIYTCSSRMDYIRQYSGNVRSRNTLHLCTGMTDQEYQSLTCADLIRI